MASKTQKNQRFLVRRKAASFSSESKKRNSKSALPSVRQVGLEKSQLEMVKDLISEARETSAKLSEASENLASAASSNEQLARDLMANMNALVVRLDKIFAMFEDASKHVGDVETAEAKISNLSTKLESLLDQNKSIAQGLILLEKYVRGKTRLEPVIQPKPLE